MTRFRIAQNDTIRAHAINKSGKIIATLYDSGFRSKSSVELALMNKIPNYSQSTIEIRIYNESKEISTRYSISVNQLGLALEKKYKVMKKSSVEFLKSQFIQNGKLTVVDFQQAKEIESKKQQKYNEMLEMLKELVKQNTYRGYEESEDVIEAKKLIEETTKI